MKPIPAPLGRAVLQKVVAKLGGAHAADQLGISPANLNRLLNGVVPVPDLILLRAVDVLDGLESQAWSVVPEEATAGGKG